MFLKNIAPFKKKERKLQIYYIIYYIYNILQIGLEKKYVRTPETRLKKSWPCLFFNRNENEKISKCFKIK